MYGGYLMLGTTEVINNHRALNYAQAAGMNSVLPCTECSSINAGMVTNYETPARDNPHPPWWQETYPIGSADFFGVIGINIDNIDDSTRKMQVSEAPGSGGFIGPLRFAVRTLTVKAVAVAGNDCSLGYGLNWLRSLDSTYNCSTSTVTMYECCPHVAQEDCDTVECREKCILKVQRQMHEARITSGPQVLMRRDMLSRGAIAQIEFVITAGDPFLYVPPFPIPTGAVADEYLVTDPEDEPEDEDPFASGPPTVRPPSLHPTRSLPERTQWLREEYVLPMPEVGYAVVPSVTLASESGAEDVRLTVVGPEGVAGSYRMVNFPAGGSVEFDFRKRQVTTEAKGIRRNGSAFVSNPTGGVLRWPKDFGWGEYRLLVDRVPGTEPLLLDASVSGRFA